MKPFDVVLPVWPARTVAVLVTVGPAADAFEGPHAIPVSAPVRADERTILLSLHRNRGSLARLRDRPQVALLVMAAGDVAFTARGTARVVAQPMAGAPDHAAVEIAVTAVDDHRQEAFTVAAGVERKWLSDFERDALGVRVGNLQRLAAIRLYCRVAAAGDRVAE